MSNPTDPAAVADPPPKPGPPGQSHHGSPRRFRFFRPMQRRLAAGLGIIWALFLVVAQLGGAFDELEQPLLDFRQALPAPAPGRNMALIAIDDIPSDRPWPWPRLDYALMMRSLLPYAPQSVVFEIPLQNPDPFYSAFDSMFANIVARYDHVIFAALSLTTNDQHQLPENCESIPARGLGRPRAVFGSLHGPLADFAGQSSLGIANLLPGDHRVPRRVPLVFQVRNYIVPGLALQAAAQYLGASLSKSEVVFGDAIYLRAADGRLLRRIPVDDEGRLHLRFRRIDPPEWKISFDNVILFADQREHGEKTALDLTQLRRRQVWVGRIDKSLAMDGIAGVTGPLCPVEVHMAAARNIIDSDFVRMLPPFLLALIYLIVGGLGASFLLDYPWHLRAAYTAVTAAVWCAAALLFFQVANLYLPVVSFVLVTLGWLPVIHSAERWDLDADEDQLPLDLG
jgi:adenylate cyclase